MAAVVLVVDDQIGRVGPHQRSFIEECSPLGNGHKDDGPQWHFEFHTGQDEVGRNSNKGLEELGDTISRQWDGSGGGRLALVLLDVRFDEQPRRNANAVYGFEILGHLRARFGTDLPIVMLSSEDEVKRARANRAEADGYLPKEQLSRDAVLDRLATCGLIEDWRPSEQRLVGGTRCFLKALRIARQYAHSPAEGLVLYGETGTGKTEFARFIHEAGRRRDGPFLTWTVRATNEQLVKDELFGHWARAFTDATTPEAGLVERAHGGTVFLDEIGELTPSVLLLLLETRRRDAHGLRSLRRLGHFPSGDSKSNAVVQAERSVRGLLQRDHSIKVDVAFLAATNRDLANPEVRKGLGFRADYFEELGLPLTVPSLNDRREDIPLIVEALLAKSEFKGMRVSREAMEVLASQDWTDRNIVSLGKAMMAGARKARDFGEILPRHLGAIGGRAPGAYVQAERSGDGPRSKAPLTVRDRLESLGATEAVGSPGGLAQEKVRYLRARVDALERALAATCVWEAELPKYSVTRAVQRLLGRRVGTTDALRLVREILDDVLEPVAYEREALRQFGLEELRVRILADPVLKEIGRYVRKEATMDAVNAELQRLHKTGPG